MLLILNCNYFSEYPMLLLTFDPNDCNAMFQIVLELFYKFMTLKVCLEVDGAATLPPFKII